MTLHNIYFNSQDESIFSIYGHMQQFFVIDHL